MAYSKTTELDLSNICFSPETGTTLSEKLTDCYRQFAEKKQNSFLKSSVVKQTIFISTTNNSEYILHKKEILACAEDYFDELPPTSIIAQSPGNGSLAVEFICIPGLQTDELIHKKNEEASWLVIQRDRMKMVIAVGAGDTSESADIFNQSDSAFRKLNGILREEGMDFSDIIRQWNYIEQITTTVNHDHSPSQHYQIFNDVRSKYYNKASFKNGFPAATGIGMDFGGIIIDIIAAKFRKEDSVVAIKSPVQLDAYSYTEEVLAENNCMRDFCRTTPKFERAKLIRTSGNNCIFISGTAAISGQESLKRMCPETQTEMTIQNILSLISKDNLQKHGITMHEKANISFLRVYVKYQKDIQAVRSVCLKYFPQIHISIVVADICRCELLVEIEGQAEFI